MFLSLLLGKPFFYLRVLRSRAFVFFDQVTRNTNYPSLARVRASCVRGERRGCKAELCTSLSILIVLLQSGRNAASPELEMHFAVHDSDDIFQFALYPELDGTVPCCMASVCAAHSPQASCLAARLAMLNASEGASGLCPSHVVCPPSVFSIHA